MKIVGIFLVLALFAAVCAQEILESNRVNEYGEDRLAAFYKRIKKSDVEYCKDRTKLLPNCDVCIPGLQAPGGSPDGPCDEYIESSKSIRTEIAQLTKERYGTDIDKNRYPRPFGLYPYLEKGDFMVRQEFYGKILGESGAKHILDIGAYYNPINMFINDEYSAPVEVGDTNIGKSSKQAVQGIQGVRSHTDKSQSSDKAKAKACPASVVIIEPILDALSVKIPCVGGVGYTHVVFLPITFKQYAKHVLSHGSDKGLLPSPDNVVCIGCDSHYGPNRNQLVSTFPRPFTLMLEFPSTYVHNGPMKKMQGKGAGETMVLNMELRPHTNDTMFTRRAMKIIHFEDKEE